MRFNIRITGNVIAKDCDNGQVSTYKKGEESLFILKDFEEHQLPDIHWIRQKMEEASYSTEYSECKFHEFVIECADLRNAIDDDFDLFLFEHGELHQMGCYVDQIHLIQDSQEAINRMISKLRKETNVVPLKPAV